MICSNKELFQKLRKTDIITENFRIKKAKIRPGFYLKPINNKIFKSKYIYISYKGIFFTGDNNYLYVSEVSNDYKIYWYGWFYKTTSDKLIKEIEYKLSIINS